MFRTSRCLWHLRRAGILELNPPDKMRVLLLTLFALIALNVPATPLNHQSSFSKGDRAIIQRRRIVLRRSPEVAKHFPKRKTAIVIYPVVTGLAPTIQRKVRAHLDFKNVFDYSLDEYREDEWLSEFSYLINHNDDYLLDITFNQSGLGAYPDDQSKHFLINLRTGNLVSAVEAFEPDNLSKLAAMIDQKLQHEITQLKKDNAASDPEEKESINDAYENLKFEAKDLNNFSVSSKGLTFLYDSGFPHVIKALEPKGRYLFTFDEMRSFLKGDGPLGQFVR